MNLKVGAYAETMKECYLTGLLILVHSICLPVEPKITIARMILKGPGPPSSKTNKVIDLQPDLL